MKKSISIAILLVMMFSLCACSFNGVANQPTLTNAELWQVAEESSTPKDENNTQLKMTMDMEMSYSGTNTTTTAVIEAIVKGDQAYMYMQSAGVEGEVWYRDNYLYYRSEYMGEVEKYKEPGTLDTIKDMIAEDASAEDFSFTPTTQEIESATVVKQGVKTCMTITLLPANHKKDFATLEEIGTVKSALIVITFDSRNNVDSMEMIFEVGDARLGMEAKIKVSVDLSRINNPRDIVFPDDLSTYRVATN